MPSLGQIHYSERTHADAWGRNGSMKQVGLDLRHIQASDEVWLRCINSLGDVSNSARLVVPRAQVPALIEALEKLR
jgi:alkylated DNA nucleotide flippase Atl1